MKKTKAIYPGSFNPFHEGHLDVLKKALELFDIVVVASPYDEKTNILKSKIPTIIFKTFKGSLVDFVKKEKASAVIRGLRNAQDFEYEKTMQYWNEDLGLVVPTIYIISDRSLVHVSSSAIRAVKKLKKKS